MKMEESKVKIIFLPYPTPGHMIPMIDAARLFARHGANVSIITTQANASPFQKTIDSDMNSGYPINTHLIHFPASQVGVPNGSENLKDATSPEMLTQISFGIHILRDQIEALFQDLQPDCLVTDMCHPWTVDSASKLGIPRIFFYSSSYFANCANYSVLNHRPFEGLESDTQKFSIPGLPHRTELTPLQLPQWIRIKDDVAEYFDAIFESEGKSYGALYNSFNELEGDYEQYYKNLLGIKAWSIGPVSAWVNKDLAEKANRGKKLDFNKEEPSWLKWLNSKQDDSVLYVNFGSLTRHPYAQLVEIAHGLENSGHNFIWVIRKKDRKDDDDDGGDGFLQDFEERMRESNKGYIIWNWAPQLLILDHPTIGGVVTHCGWNSIIETLSSGLPMITWPLFAEQFYNEIFVSDVLKVGIRVGVKENRFWLRMGDDAMVKREEVAKAVMDLMDDEESIEMRKRARRIGDAAKKSVEQGGASYNNLVKLIDEIKSLKISRELSSNNMVDD